MSAPRTASSLVVSLCFTFTAACAHQSATPGAAASDPHPSQPTSVDAPEARAPSGFSLHEVAPHTWVLHEADPWAANLLLAEMPEGSLVLVNAPATEASTHHVLDYLRARFGQRPLTVINSHNHLDAVGGNALLIESGATVLGSTQTAALVTRDGLHTRDVVVAMFQDRPELAARFAETRIAPPAHTFDPSADHVLHFGTEEVRVIYPGPAHSEDNVVVFFPQRAVLFGGCMVRSADAIGPLEQADVTHWPTAIATLQVLNATTIIPGHGLRFDAGQLENTLTLLRAVSAEHASP